MLFYSQILLNNDIKGVNNVEWINYMIHSIDKENEDSMFFYATLIKIKEGTLNKLIKIFYYKNALST